MLRKLLPEGGEPLWRDADRQAGARQVSVRRRTGSASRSELAEASAGARVAYIDRLGEAIVPQPGTVLQEGDVVHVIAAESDLDRISAAFAGARREGGH